MVNKNKKNSSNSLVFGRWPQTKSRWESNSGQLDLFDVLPLELPLWPKPTELVAVDASCVKILFE